MSSSTLLNLKTLLSLGILTSAVPPLTAQDGEAPIPPHFTVPAKLHFGESYRELKALLPGLSGPKLEGANLPNLKEAKETVEYLGAKLHFEYNLRAGGLYAYGAHSDFLDNEKGIAFIDEVVPKMEKIFGKSVRSSFLPSESDGPRNSVTISYSWPVNGSGLVLQLEFQPDKSRLLFGSQYLFSMGGFYFVGNGDAKSPRGVLTGRNGNKGEYSLIEYPGNKPGFYVFQKLIERGVTGRLPVSPVIAPEFGQTIRVGTTSLGGESPRESRLSHFKVDFPVTIWRESPNGSRHAEVHLGMDSLFPEGLEFDWKKIDLKRYEAWRGEVIRPKLLPKAPAGKIPGTGEQAGAIPVEKEPEPVVISQRLHQGLSPDGVFEVLAIEKGRDGYELAVGKPGMRTSQRTLAIPRGYLDYDGALRRSEVVWHHSSKFVAVLHHSERSKRELYVFDLRRGKPEPVRIADYVQNCVGRVGGLDTGNTAFTKLKSWAKDQMALTLTFSTTLPEKGRVAYNTGVFLELTYRPNSPARVVVKSIGKLKQSGQ